MPVVAPTLLLGKAYMLAALTFCPPAGFRPEAEVVFKPEATVYDYATPVSHLTKTVPLKDISKPPKGSRYVAGHTMGSTESSIHTGSTYEFKHITDETGRMCLYLRKARFTITYKTTVRIGAELKDYPCRRDVTKKHEEQHVAIGQETIIDSLPGIRAAIKSSMRRVSPKTPFPRAQLQLRYATAMEKMRAAVAPAIGEMEKTFHARQAEIDTFKNYKAESDRCPHEKLDIRN